MIVNGERKVIFVLCDFGGKRDVLYLHIAERLDAVRKRA